MLQICESLAGLFLNVCDLRNLGFVIYVFIVVARIFMFWSIDGVLVIVFVFAIFRQVFVFWKTRQLRTNMYVHGKNAGQLLCFPVGDPNFTKQVSKKFCCKLRYFLVPGPLG